ncbi:MAG: hypothetical protein ACI9YE_002397 [Psychroserpens sp.]|jgi:hypothetical protein
MLTKLIRKISYFILPFLVGMAFLSYQLFQSNEVLPNINSIVLSQEKTLTGFIYNEANIAHIKWSKINTLPKYDIWALGSSRVLGIREETFELSFYNAGYIVSRIEHFEYLLKSVPTDKLPKYLILGLDQWAFNMAWDINTVQSFDDAWGTVNNFPDFYALKGMASLILKGRYPLSGVSRSKTKRYGLNAILNETGFRKDGSIYYGSVINRLLIDETVQSEIFLDTFKRIDLGNKKFQYGDDVPTIFIDKLKELLAFCKEMNIEVVAFSPPFPDRVYDKMMATGNYQYMVKLSGLIQETFKTYNYEYYNFPKVSLFGSSDLEVIDGFHGGELAYGKMLFTMLQSGSKLNEVINIDSLDYHIKNPIDRYTLYDY